MEERCCVFENNGMGILAWRCWRPDFGLRALLLYILLIAGRLDMLIGVVCRAGQLC